MSLSEREPNEGGTLFDSLARLVPPELQKEFYRVLAHTKSLSPDDEMLHILEAMGVLALVAQLIPREIAGERERLVDALESHRLTAEQAQRLTAKYLQQIEDRVGQLPKDIEAGVNPGEISRLLGEALRQHFSQTGIAETVKALEQTANSLKKVRDYLAAAFADLLDPRDGVVARVTIMNRRLDETLEMRARSLDGLLHDLRSDVLKVWMPIVAGASLLIGFVTGLSFAFRR